MFILALPPEIKELLMVAIPFLAFCFIAAAVLFLTRDLFGKDEHAGGNGNGRRRNGGNGNGNGNGNSNGNGHNGNGNGNGYKKNGNGNGNGYGNGYGYAHELAIPQLAQHSVEGQGFTARMEGWFSRLLYECGAPFGRDVAFMTEMAGGLAVGGMLLVWYENLFLAVCGFFIGMFTVVGFYMLARSRRKRIMREQLPDAIEHLARAVRAGQTIDQALHLAGETTPQPLGIEFRRCAGQLDMGLSVDAAMRSFSRRVPIPEMRILASTFIVQRRAGGSLPVTLERMAKVIRDRIAYFRQFRAATAGSRMSMIVVAATGPLVALYMMIFQPVFFNHFFETSLGYIFFGTSLGLYALGLIWIYFILRLDY
jgi:tight adherence protein B